MEHSRKFDYNRTQHVTNNLNLIAHDTTLEIQL